MWDAAGQRWLSWGREVGTQALIKLVDDATPNQGTCMGIPLAQHAAMCEKRQANGNSWKSTTPIIITIPRAPFRAYVGVSFVRYQICLLWSRKLIMPTSKRLGFFFFFHVRRANNGFAPLPPLPRRQTLCPTYDDNPCLPPRRFLFAARVCHSSRPYLPEEVARSLSHTLPPLRLFLGKYSVKRNPCPGASVLLSTLGFF